MGKHTEEEYAQLSQQIIDLLVNNIASYVTPITLDSKMPFKMVGLVEILSCRVVELGRVALKLYHEKEYLSSFILSRSIYETAVLFWWSVTRIKKFIEGSDPVDFDEALMVALNGSRLEDAPLKARNIMTLIQNLDKQKNNENEEDRKTFEQIYSWFSEYAHPNSAATMLLYGKLDKEKPGLYVDLNMNPLPSNITIEGLHMALSQTVGARHRYYLLMPSLLEKVKEVN